MTIEHNEPFLPGHEDSNILPRDNDEGYGGGGGGGGVTCWEYGCDIDAVRSCFERGKGGRCKILESVGDPGTGKLERNILRATPRDERCFLKSYS
jgi:hypothetical protein